MVNGDGRETVPRILLPVGFVHETPFEAAWETGPTTTA
jgi:hypothetical protein